MAAFPDLDGVVNYQTGGGPVAAEWLVAHKEGRVGGAVAQAPVVGRYTDLFQYEGNPSHGATPGAVGLYDYQTAGGMRQALPGGGRQKWNPFVAGVSTAIGTLYLYDRITDIGTLSGTSTSAQTVGFAASPARYATGSGVEAWAEIYSPIGTTATTLTISYTNDQGTTGRTSQAVAIGGTGLREAQRMIPISLASGDAGVRSVASATLAANTTTVGAWGITLLRRLAVIPVTTANFGSCKSLVDGTMPEILGGCLCWMWLAGSVTVPNFDFFMTNLEK